MKGSSSNLWPKFISSFIVTFGHYFGNLPTTLIAAILKLYDIPLGRAPSFALEKKTRTIIKLAATLLAKKKAYSRTASSHIIVKRI